MKQLGVAEYFDIHHGLRRPIGYRLALMHPERVQAIIVQNGNAYEERVTQILGTNQEVLG